MYKSGIKLVCKRNYNHYFNGVRIYINNGDTVIYVGKSIQLEGFGMIIHNKNFLWIDKNHIIEYFESIPEKRKRIIDNV